MGYAIGGDLGVAAKITRHVIGETLANYARIRNNPVNVARKQIYAQDEGM